MSYRKKSQADNKSGPSSNTRQLSKNESSASRINHDNSENEIRKLCEDDGVSPVLVDFLLTILNLHFLHHYCPT